MTDERCPEYWGPGVRYGILHRCWRTAKHTGIHGSEGKDLHWTGKMTEQEKTRLAELLAMGRS